ncbi:MAG: hypothetical protein SF052_11210 [Bacteroidia bacterium]|nr:hypothetical protein [Bacteroidia bacterium]
MLPLLGFWMPANVEKNTPGINVETYSVFLESETLFVGQCKGWFCSAQGGNNCSCGIFSCFCFENLAGGTGGALNQSIESVDFSHIRATVSYLNGAGFKSEASARLKTIGGKMAALNTLKEANTNKNLFQQFEETASQLSPSEKQQFNTWLKSKGATTFLPL